jgi:hypothetical protein
MENVSTTIKGGETQSDFSRTDYVLKNAAESHITLTGLGMEAAIWGVLYTLLIVNTLVPYIRKTLSAKPFWQQMSNRPGQALINMAEESVLCMSISAHHLFGGSLMLYGQVTNNSQMWLHGLLVELGFEIVDIICLVLNQWPYTVVQPGLRMVTLFHHLPGLVAGPCLVLNGFHNNGDLQAIGWSLLLAGGVSLLCDSFKQTRSLETQLGQWLTLHLINMTGVVSARFVVFPVASVGLLRNCAELNQGWIYYLAVAGCGSMAIFNIIVLVLMSEKLYKNGRTFLFGKRPIKTE